MKKWTLHQTSWPWVKRKKKRKTYFERLMQLERSHTRGLVVGKTLSSSAEQILFLPLMLGTMSAVVCDALPSVPGIFFPKNTNHKQCWGDLDGWSSYSTNCSMALTWHGLKRDSHPRFPLTCMKCSPREVLIISWCEAQHSRSSSAKIFSWSSVAESVNSVKRGLLGVFACTSFITAQSDGPPSQRGLNASTRNTYLPPHLWNPFHLWVFSQ